MPKYEKQQEIFHASHQLFYAQGYENTTIRQISEKAGVSLGLVNHFFESKQNLAMSVLQLLSSYAVARCSQIPSLSADPLLHTSVTTRVVNLFLTRGGYRQFYLDCLRCDIFFGNLQNSPNRSIYELAKIHHFPVNDDLFLLYGQYIPYNYEKTLMLNKEAGLFPSISYGEIPDYIIISKFEHFLSRELLTETLAKSHCIADEALSQMEEPVPVSFASEFILSRLQ